jgi:hypothetical protein
VVMKTQGSDLYVLVPAEGTGDPTILRVNCVTDITGVGAGTRDQIETTCLSELTDRSYVGGLSSPGQVTSSVSYDVNDASLDELLALRDAGTTTQFYVGFSDGSVAGTDPDARPRPIVGGGGVVTFPATRSFVEFTGYVAEFGMDFAANNVVKSPITIQRSGSVVVHKATTPLNPQS